MFGVKLLLLPAVAAALLSASPSPKQASAPTLPSTTQLEQLFAQNSRPISFSNGTLSGPGADLLLDAGEHSQFFVIGEQHQSREIPMFTTALLKMLRPSGYDHLALEQDPLAMRLASEPPLAGNVTALASFMKRYPNATAFVRDQELEMIADASAAPTHGRAVWGLDQAFGATHYLDRLAEIAPNAEVRARTAAIAEQVRPLEAEWRPDSRFMLPDVEKSPEFLALPSFYAREPGSEADFLIQQLFLSLDIYRNWWLAAKRREPTGFLQNYDREENMKRLFMTEYRNAQQHGEALPHVVVKLGHVHSIRENWSGVFTLGDFVSEFATSNGSRSFHLAVWMNNDQPGFYQNLSKDPDFGPLFRSASPRQWVVVDFRPLRPLAYYHAIPGMSDELRQFILGFDAALLIGSGNHGTTELTGVPR